MSQPREAKTHWNPKHPTSDLNDETRSQHLLSHAACPVFASFRELDVALEGTLGRSFLPRDCHTQTSLLPQVTLPHFIPFRFLALLSLHVLLLHLNSFPLCKHTQHAMAAPDSAQASLPSSRTIAFAVAVVKSRPPELSIGGTYNPLQRQSIQ